MSSSHQRNADCPGEARPVTAEALIAATLGRPPDVQFGAERDGWRLSRWRQFIGSYRLPALPTPTFVVHIGGKRAIRTWGGSGWSETRSIPGYVTLIPAGKETGWLVDGELDVVTLSIYPEAPSGVGAAVRLPAMRFAFADPLGVALTRQVLAELYAPRSAERDAYITVLLNTLKVHVLRAAVAQEPPAIPAATGSAYRIHSVTNAILQNPEAPHRLEAMASQAGLTPSHFCRIFRKATGLSPHQYVMKIRLDRAQQLVTQSDLALNQIADSLGFMSQSHFTRAFRRAIGETPGDYRRRNGELL